MQSVCKWYLTDISPQMEDCIPLEGGCSIFCASHSCFMPEYSDLWTHIRGGSAAPSLARRVSLALPKSMSWVSYYSVQLFRAGL